MEKINTIALYIVSMCKSVNKTVDYAVSIAAWYTDTDNQQTAVEKKIRELW